MATDERAREGIDPRPPWNASLAGVRGVAILLVMAYHLALPVGEGGPVGVTVFFVLSGYLITRLLVTEYDATGTVDLVRFAIRRARRLLPALLVAVAVTSVIVIVADHGSAVGDAFLTLAYVANWARASGDPMGLWNHAWSLAIEEQFYVLWPLLFVVAAVRLRLKPDAMVIVLLGTAGMSAALRATMIASGLDDRAYFGSDSRAEALLAGCVLGVALSRRPSVAVPGWVGPVAVAAVLVLALVPMRSLLWPGALYSLTTVASCVLLVGVERVRGGTHLLASRPLVWLGTRSYSLYLWHVPVILLLGPMLPADGWVRLATLTVVSVALAMVSYAYVEGPFRRRSDRPLEPVGAKATQVRGTPTAVMHPPQLLPVPEAV